MDRRKYEGEGKGEKVGGRLRDGGVGREGRGARKKGREEGVKSVFFRECEKG